MISSTATATNVCFPRTNLGNHRFHYSFRLTMALRIPTKSPTLNTVASCTSRRAICLPSAFTLHYDAIPRNSAPSTTTRTLRTWTLNQTKRAYNHHHGIGGSVLHPSRRCGFQVRFQSDDKSGNEGGSSRLKQWKFEDVSSRCSINYILYMVF